MQKLRLFSLGLVMTACMITSCDKVKAPTETPQVIESKRKILLEDYTGHQCGNCPAAAEVAEKMVNDYNGKVILISVHAGFFSRISGSYPQDFTTPGSVEWDKTFIGNAGNPNGMVNRKNFNDAGLVKTQGSWSSMISQALRDPYYLDLYVTPKYDTASRLLNTTVRAKYQRAYPNNLMINVVIVEDSIVAPQTDYRSNPDRIPNYVFHKMLRGEINGTWGTPLKNAPIRYNDSTTVKFNDYSVPAKCNNKQLYVIAFAYDAVTREVLQVEQAKLLNK